MKNIRELEEFLNSSVNDRWVRVEVRLIGFEDNAIPDAVIDDIKMTPFNILEKKLNILEVVFTFDGYYHKAKKFTATEMAHHRDLSGLFRAVTRDAIQCIAIAAFES